MTSLLTAILVGILGSFIAGGFGWWVRSRPFDDRMQREWGDYPNTHERRKP